MTINNAPAEGNPIASPDPCAVFYSSIYPSDGLRCLAAFNNGLKNPPVHTFYGTDAELLEAADAIDAKGINVYHACAVFKTSDNRKGANALAVKSLWLDLDVGEKKPYATQKEAAGHFEQFRVALDFPLSHVVSSGNGIHQYLPFTASITLDQWDKLAGLFQDCLDHFGVKHDSSRTTDKASILRIPGTRNHKTDPAKAVTLKRVGEEVPAAELWGKLKAYADTNGIMVDSKPKKGQPKGTNELVGTPPEYTPKHGDKVAERCPVIHEVAASGGDVGFELWWRSMGVAKHTTEPETTAAHWTRNREATGHSKTDYLAELDKWTVGPTTCDEFSKHSSKCAGCVNRGKITSPIQLGVDTQYADVLSANDSASMPDPVELTETLPPVPQFPIQLLPKQIGAYAKDIAERMSCPVDFPATALTVAIAAAVGSRVHCKPYALGTWLVPGGLWGVAVSPPSEIKSPPQSEALRPMRELDKAAAVKFSKDMEQYQIQKQIYDNAVKSAIRAGAAPVGLTAPSEPVMTRYVVNDTTYEKLIEIAAANPAGILVARDELVGWFHSMNKENQKEARGLYLTGWTGTESYATDRIGRGHVRADSLNISLLGTIQPNVLRQIVYDAVAGGGGDDGLVARFQLAVYPDPVRTYVKVDRYPDFVAMQAYEGLIQRLTTLDPSAIGASFTPDGKPYLPFDDAAQKIFDDWRQVLEDRIRAVDSDEHPAMLAHLGKYRSLFPKLALVLHLAAGDTGLIGVNAAGRAKLWTEYLEAHARRIYHTATNRTMQCAVALANKIKANKLQDGFTRSDVLVKEWANLRTAEEVNTALTVLVDGYWLIATEDRNTGGRPTARHKINPKVKRAA